MGNPRWLKIECLHRVGTHESKRLKVAALNLFHPTASPLFRKAGMKYEEGEKMAHFHTATRSLRGREDPAPVLETGVGRNLTRKR